MPSRRGIIKEQMTDSLPQLQSNEWFLKCTAKCSKLRQLHWSVPTAGSWPLFPTSVTGEI